MGTKTNISLSIDVELKKDIDEVLDYRKNEHGETPNRSDYIASLIKDDVERERKIQEHIRKNEEISTLRKQLKEKEIELRKNAQNLINEGCLVEPVTRPNNDD